MKRFLLLLLSVCISFSFVACNSKPSTKVGKNAPELSGCSIIKQLPEVSITIDEFKSFESFIDYDNTICPYSELFGINGALEKKSLLDLSTTEHNGDFLKGAKEIDAAKLYDKVKSNNEIYFESVGKYFSDELSDSELKKCCSIVADSANWCISANPEIDLDAFSCILDNLKIVKKDSMNRGSFSDKNFSLSVSPAMIKSGESLNHISGLYDLTIAHETMHMIQCHCPDIKKGDNDRIYGVSYYFEDLEINPLEITWLYEASAELNAASFYNCMPNTYTYMIENLETISLATVLDDKTYARQMEKICFTFDEENLYKQLGFKDRKKAMELLYAVELLRNKPEEFKKIYEERNGTIENYEEFIKVTYNPYFFGTITKLFYKNLAHKLTQTKMSMNDVFYFMTLHEADLLHCIPLDTASVKEKYSELFSEYINIRNKFLDTLQKNYTGNAAEDFAAYEMNSNNGGIYANASLNWLDSDKKDFVMRKNAKLYNDKFKHIFEK